MKWTDKLGAVSSAISAIASCFALIGVLVAVQSLNIQQNESTRRLLKETFSEVNAIGSEIDQATFKKLSLDRNYNSQSQAFSYEYISSNHEVEAQVFKILNLYEKLCLMTKLELFSYDAWAQLRGDAFRFTFQQYRSYIEKYQKAVGSDRPWATCLELHDRVD